MFRNTIHDALYGLCTLMLSTAYVIYDIKVLNVAKMPISLRTSAKV